MAKTSTQFLAAVKRRISMPENQALLADTDILELGNDVIRSYIVPCIISVRQDYFIYIQDQALTAGTQDYDIPYRALARGLRDMKIVDSNVSIVRDLVKVDLEDAHLFSNDNNSVNPYGFHFLGDKVRIVPPPSTGTTMSIRFFIELPPNDLIEFSNAATITGISGDFDSDPTISVTVGAVPSAFTVSSSYDFIAGKQGNFTRAFDKTPSSLAGLTLTFATADVPSTLAVGDYVSLAGQSPVLQLPDDAFAWTVTKTARRCLSSISDFEGDGRLQEDDSAEEKNLKQVLEPRIRGETTKIINRFSLVRQGRFYYGRGIIF